MAHCLGMKIKFEIRFYFWLPMAKICIKKEKHQQLLKGTLLSMYICMFMYVCFVEKYTYLRHTNKVITTANKYNFFL